MLSSSQLVLIATTVAVSTVSAAYHASPPHVSPTPLITYCFTLQGRFADGSIAGYFNDLDGDLIDLYPSFSSSSSDATKLGIDPATSNLVAHEDYDFLNGYIATSQNSRGHFLMRFERSDLASNPAIKCRLNSSGKLTCAVPGRPDLRLIRSCRESPTDDPYLIFGNSSTHPEGWDCEVVILNATAATGCSKPLSTIPATTTTMVTPKPSSTAKTTSSTSKTSTITTLPTSTTGPSQRFVCPSGSPTLCADGFLVKCSDEAINSDVNWYVYSNTISELECHQACVLDPTCTGYYSYDEEIDLTLCQHTNDTFSPNTKFRFQYYFYTTGVRGFSADQSKMSPPVAIGSIDFSASQDETLSKRPLFTIDELIRARAEEMGDAPLLGYPNEGLLDFEEHSAKSCDLYADAAAHKLKKIGLSEVDPSLTKAPVVGILAQSGMHVIATTFALFRLGYSVFFISTRLASPAIVQLLKLTDCSTVLTTPTYEPVLTEAANVRDISILPLLEPSDYYGVEAPKISREYNPEEERKKIAIILHSSGSTGLPKPIFLTNGNCLSTFATNMGMRALITSPLFHAHGVLELFRSIYSTKPLYITNFKLPLTGSGLLQVLNRIKPELLHSVPYVIKLLAESEEGVRALADVKMVLYAGSGCPDSLGDYLTEKGIYLVGNYGSTETGRLMTSARFSSDLDWSYLRMIKPSEPYVLMDEISPGLYECVALDGLPSKSTINSDNPPRSFRTRDLFTRHKSRPGLWKYASRLDDRFTLINGEKVLPLPIEGHVRQSRYVRDAIVFGEGKECPGILIIRAENAAGLSDEEYFDKVWPVVQEANSRAETYSHISRELAVILPADTIFPQTDKATFIRMATYKRFANEIEQAYANLEPNQGGHLKLSGEELENFLLLNLKVNLGTVVSADDDLFAAGVDSLMCIQLRNIIRTQLDLGGRHSELGHNVIYETGNIRGLARHLEALREGTSVQANDELQVMQDLIDKYSSFTPHSGDGKPLPNQEVVLLTGATGGLGAHMLAQLVSRPNVSAVWAVVRAKSDEAGLDRIIQSLSTRGIDLSDEQKQKIIPFAGDLGQPDLGLGSTRVAELKSNLTLMIHSAWAVNFNIPVQSFEAQHIRGVHNLIQLCLSVDTTSPARFFFCSSVSSAAGSPRPGNVTETPVALPEYAQKFGYGRSKYVSEHITINSARKYGAPSRVLRIGQLVADTRVGEWNATEGMALMIQTAKTIGALPQLDEEISWLPVDLAATTILELAGVIGSSALNDSVHNITADTDLVYHVLSPKRFHYTRELHPALREAGLEFEALPPTEWMERLRNSEKDPSKNAPIKLLQWFESKYGTGKSNQAGGDLLYLTEKTTRDSPTLQQIPDVTSVPYVRKMLDRLQRHW